MIISSVDNKMIKYLKKLKSNKYVDEEKKFLIEGDHLVKEAANADLLEMVIKLEGNDKVSHEEAIKKQKENFKFTVKKK